MSEVLQFRKTLKSEPNTIIKIVDGEEVEYIDIDALSPRERANYVYRDDMMKWLDDESLPHKENNMDADVEKSIENIVAVLKSLDDRTTSLESSVKEMESKLGKIVDALAAVSTISSN
jgi:hypothetical protein